jgi:hypothetical protein
MFAARGEAFDSPRRGWHYRAMTPGARSVPAMALVAALALAACGGDDEQQEARTIVETVTTEAPPPPAKEQVPPTDEDVPTDEDLPAGQPLPPGVVGVDGTYAMTVRDADSDGGFFHDRGSRRSEWVFATSCTGPDCTIEMRRELDSGAFKTLTLTPAAGREGVFEADSTGTADCKFGPSDEASTDQRYSIKLNAPQDVAGRQTATRIDAYFTEATDGCTGPGGSDEVQRGTVSWTGILQP